MRPHDFVATMLFAIIAGCSSPSAKSRSSSESDAAAESQSHSAQGTSTTPIIIICNQLIGTNGNAGACVEAKDGDGIRKSIEAAKHNPEPKPKKEQKK